VKAVDLPTTNSAAPYQPINMEAASEHRHLPVQDRATGSESVQKSRRSVVSPGTGQRSSPRLVCKPTPATATWILSWTCFWQFISDTVAVREPETVN
jgi:hypothetical protein